jgi:UDP-N-acetylglucosamine 2-epimerase (non-hydrolysing)
MDNKTLLFIFGTRPEFLKLIPIIQKARHLKKNIITCHTGQHQETIEPLFKYFDFSPTFHFPSPKTPLSLSELSSKIMVSLDKEKKALLNADIAIIQGDTHSAFIGALWSFYNKIPVAHIEAGLRTFCLNEPFPEEGNRQLISRIATLHFCPTENDVRHLKKEGITQDVYCVGNTIIDTVTHLAKKEGQKKENRLLVTCHRRENFGKNFKNICSALNTLCNQNPTIEILFISHPNPNIMAQAPLLLTHPNIQILPAQNYIEVISLIQKSMLVLTDSGGIQEEAPSLNTPVLILRNKTERYAGLEAGTAKLIGTNSHTIVKETELLLQNKELYASMIEKKNPFGDGKSAEKIMAHITHSLSKTLS